MPPRTPKTPAKRKATQVGRGVTPVRLRYEDDAALGPPPAPRYVNLQTLIPPKFVESSS